MTKCPTSKDIFIKDKTRELSLLLKLDEKNLNNYWEPLEAYLEDPEELKNIGRHFLDIDSALKDSGVPKTDITREFINRWADKL